MDSAEWSWTVYKGRWGNIHTWVSEFDESLMASHCFWWQLQPRFRESSAFLHLHVYQDSIRCEWNCSLIDSYWILHVFRGDIGVFLFSCLNWCGELRESETKGKKKDVRVAPLLNETLWSRSEHIDPFQTTLNSKNTYLLSHFVLSTHSMTVILRLSSLVYMCLL